MIVLALAALLGSRVQVVGEPGNWRLLRGGTPYTIHGAGGDGSLAALKAVGGNSVRTWGIEGLPKVLAEADELGLTVTAGIWLQHADGMDYRDRAKVEAQTARVRQAVERFKNSPALLVWGVGNEMENGNDTPELWSAVGESVHAAKLADPDHPVMTVVAEVSQQKIDFLRKFVPDLDILGVNSYGGLPSLVARLKEYGWKKPYIVTEFGPLGHWERPKTAWGAPLEQTSTAKAAMYQAGYDASIGGNRSSCLGSYAFLWGVKEEVTPTWFGMMLGTGEPLESVDVMQHEWTGRWPSNRAPRIAELLLAGPHDDISPDALLTARVNATGSRLRYRWEVRREVGSRRPDGNGEAVPERVNAGLEHAGGSSIRFRAPGSGAYRLYVEVVSGAHRAATANVPFRVR